MCKECRRIWRTKVTKQNVVRAKWELIQTEFKNAMQEKMNATMIHMEFVQKTPMEKPMSSTSLQ